MAGRRPKRNGGGASGGSGPAVPPDTRVYAVGDCHGCADQLRALHDAILEDSAESDASGAPAKRRVVVYLGDYVDRGPDSRGVLDFLLDQPLDGFEPVHLLGNHEQFMIQFLGGENVAAVWMMNGGLATLRSYGVNAAGFEDTRAAALDLRAELEAQLPDPHRAFLDTLELSHIEGDYAFVHAGIRPGVPLDAQDPEDLLWIRDPFLDSKADHGKIVVHGHSPVREPEVCANRICIDTGACYGGHLTALVLDGDRRRFLQV